MMTPPPIPFIGIVGPTAVGKTALSLELAEGLNGEIISADSMQVYKYMDIGTAKLPPSERRGIPHHMIDVVAPTDNYTVYDYASAARQIIRDVYHKGKVPIVVGGTGLYFRSLADEFDFTETVKNEALREELELLAEREGTQVLFEKLSEKDPEAAGRIHPNDKKRLIRALEIVLQTGSPMRESYQKREKQFTPVLIGLNDERDRLYERIDERVDHMIKVGLLDEVKKLITMGCNENHTSMQAIGYKELLGYLNQRLHFDDAVNEIKKASRRYAKRQLSWFRADQRIRWYHLKEDGMMDVSFLLREAGLLWKDKDNIGAMAPEDR